MAKNAVTGKKRKATEPAAPGVATRASRRRSKKADTADNAKGGPADEKEVAAEAEATEPPKKGSTKHWSSNEKKTLVDEVHSRELWQVQKQKPIENKDGWEIVSERVTAVDDNVRLVPSCQSNFKQMMRASRTFHQDEEQARRAKKKSGKGEDGIAAVPPKDYYVILDKYENHPAFSGRPRKGMDARLGSGSGALSSAAVSTVGRADFAQTKTQTGTEEQVAASCAAASAAPTKTARQLHEDQSKLKLPWIKKELKKLGVALPKGSERNVKRVHFNLLYSAVVKIERERRDEAQIELEDSDLEGGEEEGEDEDEEEEEEEMTLTPAPTRGKAKAADATAAAASAAAASVAAYDPDLDDDDDVDDSVQKRRTSPRRQGGSGGDDNDDAALAKAAKRKRKQGNPLKAKAKEEARLRKLARRANDPRWAAVDQMKLISNSAAEMTTAAKSIAQGSGDRAAVSAASSIAAAAAVPIESVSVTYRAVHSFTPGEGGEADEMPIVKGDILVSVEKEEDGWIKVRVRDPKDSDATRKDAVGSVPFGFLEIFKRRAPPAPPS